MGGFNSLKSVSRLIYSPDIGLKNRVKCILKGHLRTYPNISCRLSKALCLNLKGLLRKYVRRLERSGNSKLTHQCKPVWLRSQCITNSGSIVLETLGVSLSSPKDIIDNSDIAQSLPASPVTPPLKSGPLSPLPPPLPTCTPPINSYHFYI